MTAVAFYVIGTPASQGSKRHVGGGRLIEASKTTAPWRALVTGEAMRHRPAQPLDGPLDVELVFTLPRPKSAPKRETMPTKKPDLDKLVRAVFDSLTDAGIWADDARVVSLIARKRWPVLRELVLPVPGVAVVVNRDDRGSSPEERFCLVRDVHHLWGRTLETTR